ncbi:hypothetical protein N7516_009775 [Penicillium verrucosum]|uniref:uncharacterized protein n=1 Tax=Penicillium verrucosum TaxID=60171 RepID=UPI002545BA65|nr:uncharacterized protein N7516_009775 [Penicillium verrucosum]KAJ5922072.1 hypothetical protein N7516_009775 [Penicillium verrucosum]
MDCKSPKNCQPDGEPPKGIKIRCPVCKYRKFRSEQAFCDHIQDQHNLFPCMNCDAIFACKDDLVQHRNEKHPKVPSKLTHNRKTKGKLRPVIRKVSLPASENIPSTQPLLQPRPPTRARPPVAHARQPSTKTRKPPAQIRRQSTMQPRQSSGWPNQGNKLGHPAHAQVFRPSHSSIFHSQHQLHQIRHPLPPRPVKIYRGPSHGFRVPSRDFAPAAQSFHLAGQVTQVPLGFYKASDQVFQPVAVPGPPARFYHPRATSYETPTPPYYASSPVYQSPPRDQNQMANYRAASDGRRTPTPIRQTHPRRMKNKVHVYRAPPQATQFPKENLQSSQEFADSNFFNQESQHQEPQQVEQVFRVPVRSPARDSPSPEQYSQQAKEVARFPHLDSQPPQRSQSSEWNSQDSEIPQSLEGSKSPEQANNQAEQVSQSFSQISQHLEHDPPLEPSQFLRQVFQEAEKVTQSRQKHSQSLGNFPFLIHHYKQAEAETISQSTPPYQFAMPILEKTDQVSHSSLHLSAHDPVTAEANESDRATTSTPATNITTPTLSNPPLPRNRTFSLVYGTMPHRWTNLEPLEQTLILRYLLATCHTPKRLHSQGYNAPKTIKTESCENNGQPHQQHLDPLPTDANTTHRKAIVLDCKMIETTTCTSELAFITAIDFLTGEVLINSYVTPTAPVTNWLTPVSGITQEKMDAAIAEGNVLVSNADARGALRKFLNRDTVLIGHTLQHALRTLSLIHGRIVDTSVVTGEAVFSNAASKTTLPRIWGLETLARELVGIQIRGGDEGHSSLEDALATREILIWCLRGPQCLKAWAEKTRGSLYRRNRRGARGNRGNEGGGANANNGQENTSG